MEIFVSTTDGDLLQNSSVQILNLQNGCLGTTALAACCGAAHGVFGDFEFYDALDTDALDPRFFQPIKAPLSGQAMG